MLLSSGKRAGFGGPGRAKRHNPVLLRLGTLSGGKGESGVDIGSDFWVYYFRPNKSVIPIYVPDFSLFRMAENTHERSDRYD
jgi:hypothetical protein